MPGREQPSARRARAPRRERLELHQIGDIGRFQVATRLRVGRSPAVFDYGRDVRGHGLPILASVTRHRMRLGLMLDARRARLGGG